jgi:hypothetical protein
MAKDENPPAPAPEDVVLLVGKTQDGEGVQALRAREGRVEAAELRPLEEGKPIVEAEVVRLKHREGSPLLWDVEVQHDGRTVPGEARSGPARVASAQYRQNWDRVFGAPAARRKVVLN